MKIPLTKIERENLKKNGFKKEDLKNLALDEVEVALDVPMNRAKELLALIEFQSIPSIGIKFANALFYLGYHTLSDLEHLNGARLAEEYERKVGYWIDPCMEDQFWLAVDYAKNRDNAKNWWDYSKLRKDFRMQKGYPLDRPKKPWHECDY